MTEKLNPARKTQNALVLLETQCTEKRQQNTSLATYDSENHLQAK